MELYKIMSGIGKILRLFPRVEEPRIRGHRFKVGVELFKIRPER